MKRILVVDESAAVRETLSLLLGRDFTVIQRPPLPDDGPSGADEEADLVVLGVPSGLERDASAVSQVAARVSCPVLLLVESRAAAEEWKKSAGIDCLVKPFNPYELKEKVERLLVRSALPAKPSSTLPSPGKSRLRHYLDFPYLPEATSALARSYALAALPILIEGEVGCGQEQVARAIYSSSENAGPWISAYPPEISGDAILERIGRLSWTRGETPHRVTLFLGGLDALGPAAQASLLSFLEEQEDKGRQFWILSNSQSDLLEKAYRGEFLTPLYYRLATLTLRLPPLRERRAELPALAAALAQGYVERLSLGKVSFSEAATERLCNYLWFGNLDEMGAVIARTLVTHRKSLVEASDLIFGAEAGQLRLPQAAEAKPAAQAQPAVEKEEQRTSGVLSMGERSIQAVTRPANGDSPDIKVLINELAHELKNPMVTIKTFAQLLGERFDDAAFRARFQETVGGDIERMDDLLEAMLDFSRFTHPETAKLPLYEQLRRALEEIVPECIKRQATIRWGKKVEGGEVFADEAQLRYAFKNVLRAVLAQVGPRGEIQIDVEGEGRVAVSYVAEGGRMSPLAQYLDLSSSKADEESLPLRILLAKILLERNGGGIKVSQVDGGKVLIRAQLPVA